MSLSFSASAYEEQGDRPEMEDAHVVQTLMTAKEHGMQVELFAVFDGHVTAHVSKYLCHTFPVVLKRNLLASLQIEAFENAIRQSFVECNAAILARVDNKPGAEKDGFQEFCDGNEVFHKGGSTAVVALLVNANWLFVANCGDSEAILLSSSAVNDEKQEAIAAVEKNKREWAEKTSNDEKKASRLVEFDKTVPALGDKKSLLCLSKLHKPQLEVERIQKAGSYVHRGRINDMLSVSRSFGDFDFSAVIVDPHISKTRVAVGDTFILACDGLWDVFSYEEAMRAAIHFGQPGNSENTVSQSLVESAIYERRSLDNVTAIVVSIGKDQEDVCEQSKSASASSTTAPKTAPSQRGFRQCHDCSQIVPKSSYSKSQWAKRPVSASRCQSCVAK